MRLSIVQASRAASCRRRSEADAVTSFLPRRPTALLLLGPRPGEGEVPLGLGGSAYVARRSAEVVGPAPVIDLTLEAKLQRLVLGWARAHALLAAHDVSGGGLALCLAEMCAAGPHDVGADLALPKLDLAGELATVGALFGEGPSRIVVAVDPATVDARIAEAKAAGVPVVALGRASDGETKLKLSLGGAPVIEVEVAAVRAARDACLQPIVGA
jgi:phosphoribosylformylglycinamidine synthase